ncbi:MAG: hypothetical protein ACK5NB_11465 [Flavobacteriaceae bacterium]
MLKKIVIILVVGFALFILMLFFTLKNKKKDLSNTAPYNGIVGKELVLLRPVVLCKNDVSTKILEDYTIYTDTTVYKYIIEDAPEHYTLNEGSILKVASVKHFQNPVSGSTRSLVIGKVVHPTTQELVNFEYEWGKRSTSDILNGVEKSWYFPLAPWQENAIEGKFEFPKPFF